MKHQNVPYIAVGLFVLSMLVGLVVLLAWLSGRTGPADRYFVDYANVAGVVRGTPVSYQGYPIGRVEALTPRPTAEGMRYRLELAVEAGWPIPEDSLARVVASGLLSAITIDIAEGTSKSLAKPGAQLAGREGANLFAAIDAIAGNVGELTEHGFMPLLENLNRRVDHIAGVLEEHGPRVLGNLESSSAKLDAGVGEVLVSIRELTSKLRRSADDLGRLVGPETEGSVRNALASVEASAANFEKLSADLQQTRGRLDTVVKDSQAIVSGNRRDIEQSVADLRASLQSVSRHIGAVTRNLEVASRNMAEFSREIRQNPGLLIGGTPPADRAR
ncbi:MlaD family protein [Endothiovibrio diazotrophicus]